MSNKSYNFTDALLEDYSDKSFGDFIGDMLTDGNLAMLDSYCHDYFDRFIGKGLGAYSEKNYRYYKQRLLKKINEIGMLSEEDKNLSWHDLETKYLSNYGIKQALKNGDTHPYKVFYALRKAAGSNNMFLPSLDK